MKRKFLPYWGALVFVLAFGLVLAGCPTDTPHVTGTKYTLSDGSTLEVKSDGSAVVTKQDGTKITGTHSGGTVTLANGKGSLTISGDSVSGTVEGATVTGTKNETGDVTVTNYLLAVEGGRIKWVMEVKSDGSVELTGQGGTKIRGTHSGGTVTLAGGKGSLTITGDSVRGTVDSVEIQGLQFETGGSVTVTNIPGQYTNGNYRIGASGSRGIFYCGKSIDFYGERVPLTTLPFTKATTTIPMVMAWKKPWNDVRVAVYITTDVTYPVSGEGGGEPQIKTAQRFFTGVTFDQGGNATVNWQSGGESDPEF